MTRFNIRAYALLATLLVGSLVSPVLGAPLRPGSEKSVATDAGVSLVIVLPAGPNRCDCVPYIGHEIPFIVTPPPCQLPDGSWVPEFDYLWGGPVPGTGALVPGNCNDAPTCPAAEKKCSWPSYSLIWEAAPCAQGGPFKAQGPGGTQIGQDFIAGGSSSAIVFSPSTKDCNSGLEVLVSTVNYVSSGAVITRVEVETRCRQCILHDN